MEMDLKLLVQNKARCAHTYLNYSKFYSHSSPNRRRLQTFQSQYFLDWFHIDNSLFWVYGCFWDNKIRSGEEEALRRAVASAGPRRPGICRSVRMISTGLPAVTCLTASSPELQGMTEKPSRSSSICTSSRLIGSSSISRTL